MFEYIWLMISSLSICNKSLNDFNNFLDEFIDEVGASKYLNEGVKVVLTGPPNVGKSTLMNYFTDVKTSIVSEIPGTTRDIVQKEVKIKNLKKRLESNDHVVQAKVKQINELENENKKMKEQLGAVDKNHKVSLKQKVKEVMSLKRVIAAFNVEKNASTKEATTAVTATTTIDSADWESRLFVQGPADLLTEEFIQENFSEYGQLEYVKLLYKAGKPKGMAFVKFTTVAGASNAVKTVNENEDMVGTVPVKVSIAEPQKGKRQKRRRDNNTPQNDQNNTQKRLSSARQKRVVHYNGNGRRKNC